jgi:hypothetical protein
MVDPNLSGRVLPRAQLCPEAWYVAHFTLRDEVRMWWISCVFVRVLPWERDVLTSQNGDLMLFLNGNPMETQKKC